MNKYGLLALSGFLVLDDGRCRAYKAIRDEINGCLYFSNDTFCIVYLVEMVEAVLTELKLIQ